ncbi:MAG: hypothetical protein Q8P65_00175 [bacterium]|nr:hypothetical protein [bacterium]
MTTIYYFQFFLFVFLVTYPLGKIILNYLKINLTFWESLLISINIGIVILILLAFFSGIIGLGKFFYFFPVAVFIILLSRQKLFEKYRKKLIFNIDFKLLGILLITVLLCGYFTFFSGQIVNKQLRLIGGNVHDGLWHIALINNLKKNIPPENPIYAGTTIRNYHYLTDIFVAISSDFTKIPVMALYFKIIEPFFILLFSATIFIFLNRITGSRVFSYYGVILTILSSNLFYLVNIFYPTAYFNPSVLWVDEFITMMVNPQLLLSYIVILTLLYLILIYEKILNLKFILLISVVGASLLGIKSYGLIVLLISFFTVSLFQSVRKRFDLIKITGGMLLASVVFYLFSNISKQSIFILSPLWFIKSMFETPDHLAYPTWELKRQTFLEHRNYLRIGQLYIEGLALFLFGNLGGRIIGFLAIFNRLENKKKEAIYILWFMSIVSLMLPLIFIQKGVAWNSIQFFYYAIISLGILTVIFLNDLYKKHKYLVVVLAMMVWITLLPGIIYNLVHYFPDKSSLYGSSDALSALQFFKNQPDGTVLINPIYMNESFVPALSEKTAFLADESILSIQLVDYDRRKEEVKSFFSNINSNIIRGNFLKENDIKYIFTVNDRRFNYNNALDIKEIYSNKEIIIYKVI